MGRRETDGPREGRPTDGQREPRGRETENDTQRKEGEEEEEVRGVGEPEEEEGFPCRFLRMFRAPRFLYEFSKLLIGDSLPAFILTHRADETVLISSLVGGGGLLGI